MRVFVALPISGKIQKEISEWEGKHKNLPVRWLLGKNLHITLIPPWQENDIESLMEKLKILRNKSSSFEIGLRRVSYGPVERKPRLIWAEGEAPEEVLKLKQGLENILGMSAEKRPFRLHLTLARFRPEIFSSFKTEKLNEEISWKDKIEHFVLMESHLSPAGADYEILEKIPLR